MNVLVAIAVLTVTAILGEFRHRYQVTLEDEQAHKASL
jgi:hypothetical protein